MSRLLLTLLVIGAGTACRGDAADASGSSGAASEGSSPAPLAPAVEAAEAAEAACPPLSITIDGEPLVVGSVHAYTAHSPSGELYGHFLRASAAADVTCDEVLANRGVQRDGVAIPYVTAFKSPRSDRYDTLLTAGYSEIDVTLTYEEHDDGTRSICVPEPVTFNASGARLFEVVGEFRGVDCGTMQM